MAKLTTRRAGPAKSKPDFHRQTVLFQWALSKLGVKSLHDFRQRFGISPDSADGLDERTGMHRFFEAIAGALPGMADGSVIPVDRVQSYEQNILEHTQTINVARLHHGEPKINWKYHQYLALLFTEFFLDQYFENPEELREQINAQIARHNAQAPEVDRVEPFPTDADAREQLSRLAFWCATGSGKTLLMHVNVRQFRHYHRRAFHCGKWPRLDQIILVTPNDGLSNQHAMEFTQSGFNVITVGERGIDGLFADLTKNAIKILSIHIILQANNSLLCTRLGHSQRVADVHHTERLAFADFDRQFTRRVLEHLHGQRPAARRIKYVAQNIRVQFARQRGFVT